ncbi:hypothetical protein [Ferrovibrio sp.]|uniref:hypothetical protein n=1 Tax=Ferrovibrio sp. TaxID=1917215 RepID=UPI00262CE7E5|nr:hypothetical protein [Ferrovibrio sp.]
MLAAILLLPAAHAAGPATARMAPPIVAGAVGHDHARQDAGHDHHAMAEHTGPEHTGPEHTGAEHAEAKHAGADGSMPAPGMADQPGCGYCTDCTLCTMTMPEHAGTTPSPAYQPARHAIADASLMPGIAPPPPAEPPRV